MSIPPGVSGALPHRMGPSCGRFHHGGCPQEALYTVEILIVVDILVGSPRSAGEKAIQLPLNPLSSGYRCCEDKYFSDSPVLEMSCRFGHSDAQDLEDGSEAENKFLLLFITKLS